MHAFNKSRELSVWGGVHSYKIDVGSYKQPVLKQRPPGRGGDGIDCMSWDLQNRCGEEKTQEDLGIA